MERYVSDNIAIINSVWSKPVTTSVYEIVDRRTEVNHLASGITSFTYDPFGNVLTKQTANMAEEGKMITYTYDNRRHLSNLAVNSGGAFIMYNTYTFDAVSNVLSVANNTSLPSYLHSRSFSMERNRTMEASMITIM